MLRIKFYRGTFGGWTAKAVRSPYGSWIPRRYVLHWVGRNAPETSIADVPQWLWDKCLREDEALLIINPEYLWQK